MIFKKSLAASLKSIIKYCNNDVKKAIIKHSVSNSKYLNTLIIDIYNILVELFEYIW